MPPTIKRTPIGAENAPHRMRQSALAGILIGDLPCSYEAVSEGEVIRRMSMITQEEIDELRRLFKRLRKKYKAEYDYTLIVPELPVEPPNIMSRVIGA